MEETTHTYEVFLSFRGRDTRSSVVTLLYEALTDAGIRVFKDDDELNFGGSIADEHLRAIVSSKIYMIIFSENYASSKWCLRELVEMVSAKEERDGKEILPIFYKVTADDVKLKTDLYMKQLSDYKTSEAAETVELWKKALSSIPDCRGWELMLKNLHGDAELCQEVVKRVLVMLKLKHKLVPGILIGIDDQVESLLKLLDIKSDDVKVIGIAGMGGIGKTTLAKVVFDELCGYFDYSSFLPNIRDTLQDNGRNWHLELPKKLLSDLGNKNKGIRDTVDAFDVIRSICRERKVLIVLDDVDEVDEIKSLIGDSNTFYGGSRVIFTARDAREMQIKGQVFKLYEMEEMKKEHALQLFSWHAFRKPSPPTELNALSNHVISDLIGGLPLYLEVIGSLLYGKSREKQHLIVEKLEKIPKENVLEKLKISYEGLSYEARQIFLDVTLLFVNMEVTSAVYMWESCNLLPELGIDELISLSLVKVDKNKFWVHDLIRDLARETVHQNSLKGLCSRFWVRESAIPILSRAEGKDYFGNMKRLRFLRLEGGVKWDGLLEHPLPNLRWLTWDYVSLDLITAKLDLKKLVFLDLSDSDVTENWDGWKAVNRELSALKVLDLSKCSHLTKTPNLSNCINLERLILQHCKKLVQIDSSIGRLSALKVLNLKGCDQVQQLPDSIGDGKSMMKSEFYYENLMPTQLRNLPGAIANLEALVTLNLCGAGITALPDNIGALVHLETLSLSNCSKLRSLPDSIGKLVKLKCLLLSGCCTLISVPNSMKSLDSLQLLDLSLCAALKSFPESAEIRSRECPDSSRSMCSLKEINISRCGIKKLPNFIIRHKKLEVIKAERSGLDGVPVEIEELTRLKVLKLTGTRISGLPSLIQLTSLEDLDLVSCDHIQQLPMLPASLTCLHIISESLQSVSDLSNLTKLKSLQLISATKQDRAQFPDFRPATELPCFNLDWIGSLSELRKLSLTISKIRAIPTKFCALSQLRELTLQCLDLQCTLPLPYNLTALHVSHFKQSTSLYLSLLKNLKMLTLSNCEDLTEIPGLGELESLRSLYVSNCPSLERLDDFSKLKRLESLELSSCSSLRAIQGLQGLESLVRLNIDMCSSLERLTAVPKLKNASDIRGLGESKSSGRLNSPDQLVRLKMLDVFISRCSMLKDLPSLEKLAYVRSLIIKDCSSLERLSDLSELKNLTKMTLQKCEKLREIQGLEELESVKSLVIQDCSSLERLPNLSNLRWLERLHIEKCKKLKDIDGLESALLKYVHISDCNSLEQLGINPLEMSRLEYVCIEFCNSLREIHNASSSSPQLLRNNSEVNHCQMSFGTLPSTNIGSLSSLVDQDSDSSDFSSVKEDVFAGQCSVSDLDDHHLQSSSDEEESERTTRCLTRGSTSNTKAAAAKAVLKRFFTGGIETLAGSVDLVPVFVAAKALSRVEEETDGDYFWNEFCSKIHETSSSYKMILDSIEAAKKAHAKYAELKESAVKMRNNYRSVNSQMDQVQATKDKALSEIDTLKARLVELENTVIQANQQLQNVTSERQVLMTAMKEQVRVMKATQEEIQSRDAERDASLVQLNSLKAQWDSWVAHLDLVDLRSDMMHHNML